MSRRIDQQRIAIGVGLRDALEPVVEPAPGLFSTMIGWPIWVETCSKTRRGTMSVVVPAPNVTTTCSAWTANCRRRPWRLLGQRQTL